MRKLRWADVLAAFLRPPSPEWAEVRGGIDGGTLFLIGIDGAARALYTASRMDNASSSTVAGRAAWRRQRRLTCSMDLPEKLTAI